MSLRPTPAALPFAALLVLASAACRQPVGDPDPADALRSWCELKATNECDYRIKCGFNPAGGRTECIEELWSTCANDAAFEALREGRSRFIESRAQDCPTNFYRAECGPYPSCPLPFEGALGEAERCTHDVECSDTAGGFRCVGSGCERTCQRVGEGPRFAPGAIAQSCGGEVCLDGWCDRAWENGEQVRASCEPYRELGAPCPGVGSCNPKTSWCDTRAAAAVCAPLPLEGEECGSYGECQRGLFCDQGISPRRCSLPRDRGEPCAWDDGCRLGLTCRRLSDGAEKRCAFFAREGEFCEQRGCDDLTTCNSETKRCEKLNPQPGERCTERSWCQNNSWCQLGPDGKTGTCVAPVPEGSACGDYFKRVEPRCERGLDCSPASKTCSRPPGEGEACNSSCAAGLFCHPQSGTCTHIPGLGEPCAPFCGPRLVCVDGACASIPALGESCAGARMCSGAALCDPVSLHCVAKREPGEPCASDWECRLGICDEGLCVAACR